MDIDEDNSQQSLPNISASNNNIIYYYDFIDDKNILLLKNIIDDMTYTLLKKSRKYHFEPVIHLHIKSSGGDAMLGLNCYSYIKNNEVPIYTYIDGFIASAATLLYLGGHYKYIYTTSYMLIHQISVYNFGGKFSDFKDEQTHLANLTNSYKKIYADEGNKKLKRKSVIDKLICNEIPLNYKEIIDFGFADQVL